MPKGMIAKVKTIEGGIEVVRDMTLDEMAHMLLDMAENAESTTQADFFLESASRVLNEQEFVTPDVLH